MSRTRPETWWHDAVVYQVYPRSFADGTGDGIGDLAGMADRLDHLAWLGVDVVWLSPVYPSPQDDNGYDIADYRDIDPLYGDLDGFDHLVDELHARDMRLVMDLVVNHTSDEHDWFVDSRSGPDSARRDWYWWRPPRPGHEPGSPGAEPTNWGSFFSGSAWEFDESSGEYYLHLFSRKQPDLNWENPAVRTAVHEMMNWWLDRGVDGFRMDVINLISKDPELPDGPVMGGSPYGDGSAHYVCGPRIHEFLQEMHREVFADRTDRLLTVGEMPGVTVEQARDFTDPARAEVDMVFQFEHVALDQAASKWDHRPLSLVEFKTTMNRWQVGLADVGWNSLYLENHDQPRSVSRFGDDGQWRARSATMLATVVHLHHGTPYVYQGQEIGMANFPFTDADQFRDIESVNHHAAALAAGADRDDLLAAMAPMSRDNARTPMQWDATEHAGFTTGQPWIAVNPDHVDWNVAAQRDDPTSVLHHYRALIALRHDHDVVAIGDFTMLAPEDPHVYAFLRRHDDVELLVLGNFTDADRTVDLGEAAGDWAGTEVLLGNVSGDPPDDPAALRPWEARVHRREVSPG
ncbi:glycoside hydrolase family 13 protein [Salsipaludibacter albus]|uniref:glycoside hydrolase family 13 protein n=1 Tax=Salsipaludibacter albus TaxID=2849650 RepID=UPI001EE48BD8|nr:alpha-glucosidase [Salsipaludibacter albus]MBY5161286.1 alpha-glucosidase [Salsipaludibacter albus]